MKTLLFIHDDGFLLDFLKNYLEYRGYISFCAQNGGEGIRIGVKEIPDLIIVDKNVKGIELEGFFIKRNISPVLKNIPLFLIGNFQPDEVRKYSRDFIKAFINVPVNPNALVERLNLFFNIQDFDEVKSKRTPMLVDMHSKGNILIIQIEGNLEPDKLEILNFQIRSICRQKKIRSPRFLFIIPSLYPEAITANNLSVLFKFMTYPELKVGLFQIKILTQCQNFLDVIKNIAVYKDIEIAINFIEAVQKLNLDIDNKKEINIEHLKPGASYIFDLYDDTGMVRIPALTKLTEEMIDYLVKMGEKKFSYYSETSIEDVKKGEEVILSKSTKDHLERIISEYDQIDDDFDVLKNLKEDKIRLFLSKMKDHNVLAVSGNGAYIEIINQALNHYVNLKVIENVSDMSEIIDKNYISIFLDIELNNPNAIELLKMIRTKATRRQTSVIITAKSITKELLNTLKNYGTDNILLAPFTANKVIQKIFESVSADRST